MFTKVDCVRLPVADIDSALLFYSKKLGLDLVWRRGDREAGLKLKQSDTEIVLVKEDLIQPEIDFKVDEVMSAVEAIKKAGGRVTVEPFEISIGKCAGLEDPWNNTLVILDSTNGMLKVDDKKNVID